MSAADLIRPSTHGHFMPCPGAAMPFVFNDGGRAAAGIRGGGGDCVTRAIVIAGDLPYRDVMDELSDQCRRQRVGKNGKRKTSARNGVDTSRVWFKRYMCDGGWVWTPTMEIGTGCRVHLRADELPGGRLIVSLSGHYAAVIDGQLHDTYDCSRGGTRCVYGYWQPGPQHRLYMQ